jgi:methionine-rich copper-binding protein CopC
MTTGTILVALAVLALVALIIYGMARQAKQAATCGSVCSTCPMARKCVEANEEKITTVNITFEELVSDSSK